MITDQQERGQGLASCSSFVTRATEQEDELFHYNSMVLPIWHDSVVENGSMDQEVTVQFLVGAHAQVASLIAIAGVGGWALGGGRGESSGGS